MRLAFMLAALLSIVASMAAWAAVPSKTHTAAICDSAARRAAQHHGVPVDILRALTRTETGRKMAGKLRPWPWTVNMEGAGFWFDTADEALAFALKHHKRGARSFDVGCFQINYRWHGEAFQDIPAMFDPETNALYAAKFLKDLYRESGDWARAAGHYHSRTPDLSKKYRTRFSRIHASLGPAPADVPLPRPVVVATAERVAAVHANGQPSANGSIAGLRVLIGQPQHAGSAGGVRQSAFSDGSGLLPQARPLFD